MTASSAASRRRAGLAGLLAAAASLVAAEGAARTVPGAVSPVLAVGRAVIAGTPTSVRELLVGQTGTADKPLLVVGTVTAVLLLGAVAGLQARRSLPRAAVTVLMLGLLAAQLTRRSATASTPVNVAVELLAAVLGVAVLRLLLPSRVAAAEDGAATAAVAGGTAGRAAGGRVLPRRRFLTRAAGVALVTAAGALAVRASSGARIVAALRARVRLPVPSRPAPAVPADAVLDVAGLSALVTSNADFYRIDTALATPQVDPRSWSLRVGGLVDRELRLTYDDLLALPQTEAWVTLGCVGNRVGGSLVGTTRWQGVLLADLLRWAGPRPGAAQVVGRSVDGYTGAFPLSLALDGRTALVAVAMGGEPLPVEHGFPARLIVPGLYGYESAVKWLAGIELADAGFEAFWVPRGYAKVAEARTTSRIDTPARSTRLPAGPVTVAGMAWAPHRGVTRAEVAVDGGPWQPAQLAAATLGPDAWRPWQWTWPATPGEHVLTVRATDSTGAVQDPALRGVLPDGATGLHQVRVTVVAA